MTDEFSLADADAALQRLRDRWGEDNSVDFTLTNLGGQWRVVMLRRYTFQGDTPNEAVERALVAYGIHEP